MRRAFAGMSLSDLDPFVHMDQMGEVDYAPGEPKGTPWHPHRGFETVTYMIDGTFAHQDSHGGGGLITDGATQWMTAGGGILHIETPPEELVVSGGLFHGIQLWVNLPAKDKMIPPAYQGLEAGDVTLLSSAGRRSPRAGDRRRGRRPRRSGIDAHADGARARHRLARRASSSCPGTRRSTPSSTSWPDRVGSAPTASRSDAASWRSFGPGDWIARPGRRRRGLRRPANLEVLVLGGQPIGEPVEHYGPFVMNTRAEIAQAVEDFEAGRLGTIPPERADAPRARPQPGPRRAHRDLTSRRPRVGGK